MANNEVIIGSTRGSAEARSSAETLVTGPGAGPLPKKRGEIGWVPSTEEADAQQQTQPLDDQLPAQHPVAPSTPIPPPSPSANETQTYRPNISPSSLQSCSSAFGKLFRTRPLPRIHGVRSSTALRPVLIAFTLIGTVIGWVLVATRLSNWDQNNSTFADSQPPSTGSSGNSIAVALMPRDSFNQMTHSSLVFVHVAFGVAVLFQLLVLERAVYQFRAERYAFLHPVDMTAAMTSGGTAVMALAPWNRPPLPTYAAALGVRGTGDVEDNIIAVPPPPEYGNIRDSTLLLSSHLPSNLSFNPNRSRPNSTSSQTREQGSFRPASQRSIRDALGRSIEAWSRPVSYGEDEMRENARRSLNLEVALSRLEGPGASPSPDLALPEPAVVRK